MLVLLPIRVPLGKNDNIMDTCVVPFSGGRTARMSKTDPLSSADCFVVVVILLWLGLMQVISCFLLFGRLKRLFVRYVHWLGTLLAVVGFRF